MAPRKRILKGTVIIPGTRKKTLDKTLPAADRPTARPSLLVLDPTRKWGPAMAKLTDNRKRLVIAWISIGMRSYTEAAWIAGFCSDRASAKSEASRMFHDPTVLAAIDEELDAAFRGRAPRAMHVLFDIMEDEEQPGKVRLDAAKEVLNRGGHIVSNHTRITVEHTLDDLSTEELLQKITAFSQQFPQIEHHHAIAENTESIAAEFAENPAPIDAEFEVAVRIIESLPQEERE